MGNECQECARLREVLEETPENVEAVGRLITGVVSTMSRQLATAVLAALRDRAKAEGAHSPWAHERCRCCRRCGGLAGDMVPVCIAGGANCVRTPRATCYDCGKPFTPAPAPRPAEGEGDTLGPLPCRVCGGDHYTKRHDEATGKPLASAAPAAPPAPVLRAFWVAEAPNHPGVYAAAVGVKERVGKLVAAPAVSTTSIHNARRFDTREECEVWIRVNPSPPFVAREHAWSTRPKGEGSR